MLEQLMTSLDVTLVKQWLVALGAFLIALLILGLVGKAVKRQFTLWTRATKATWDDALLEKMRSPGKALIVFGALAIAGQFVPQALRGHPALVYGFKIGVILIFVWSVDRLLWVVFRHGDFPVTFTEGTRTLCLTVARALVFGITFLIILDTLGISITPILASLGVGSVAIALALQDTLSNLFAGIYILIDRPVRIGDTIKHQDGVEGQVKKIGWRSTQILLSSNNLVVIPNTKMSSSMLTNYDLPTKETSFSVELSVGYDNDLEKVEAIVIKIAESVLGRFPGAVPTEPPVVRFAGTRGSSIDFTLYLRAQQLSDTFLLKHELVKAIHAQFRKEGIQLPLAQHLVHQPGPFGPPSRS